jgi:hypothetical protein
MKLPPLAAPFAVAAALVCAAPALTAQDISKLGKDANKDCGPSLIQNNSKDTWQIRTSDRFGSWVQLKIYNADDMALTTPIKILDGSGQKFVLDPGKSVKMVVGGSKYALGLAVHCNVSFDRISGAKKEDLARVFFSHACLFGNAVSKADLLDKFKSVGLTVPDKVKEVLGKLEPEPWKVKEPADMAKWKNKDLDIDPKMYTKAGSGPFLILK